MRLNGKMLLALLTAPAARAFTAHTAKRSSVSVASPSLLRRTTLHHSRPPSSLPSPLGTPSTPFDDGRSPYQITTPIYYVNDKPHIGHAYTSLACDVLARYMRLSQRDVYFLTGTDEHGQKVQTTAATKGMDPLAFCDEVSRSFRELLTLLDIDNDRFIRTTEEFHKESVRHLWNVLKDNGAIYLGSYEGWYSVRDECYYNESELIDGKAPTGAEVTWVKKEDSYFFKLSDYQQRLLDHYERHPDFIAPDSRRNEVVAFVKGGLKDLSISRTTFDWGVSVPDDEDHVMYVWIDALTNYISALGYPNTEKGSKFDTYWPAALHVVGKDILRFHAVYWPAFLMAANLPLPKRIFAHGWWTKDGEKISKSLGNVIDPVELVETYGVDPTRFFLMSEVTFGNDGDFSDEKMIYKVNANLSNELGNLNQRILTLVFKNCDGAVPVEIGEFTKEDEELLATARSLRERTGKEIASQSIHKYVDHMISMVWDANKYIDVQAPWVLKKTDPERMKTVLYVLMEVMRHVAILYQPLMPTSSNVILDQLNVPKDERGFEHLEKEECKIQLGREISKPKAVFPRFEVPTAAVSAETVKA
mmetsp:Transcript_13488/g.26473  ORF Transcript_13488/g.26473 Transcript_13488/m.26473 type:complete len:588 (-) Transcript_13488:134-1897(-)